MKKVIFTIVNKESDFLDNDNYRLFGILPPIIKVYERALLNLIFVIKILCGFSKIHSTLYVLSKLLQAWQREPNKSENVDTILMDFSKATWLSYSIGIFWNILFDNIHNRKQGIRIGSSLSSWHGIITVIIFSIYFF